MYKTILLLLLIIIANPAWANWAEVMKSENGTFYIDQTNIRKNGQFAKVWLLNNLKEQEHGITSTVSLQEYDCNEERMRYLSMSKFSGQMGSGTSFALPVEEAALDKWSYIRPRSLPAFIHALVCHEWVKIAEDVYFDPVSIRKNGQLVTSWILFDNMPRDSKGAISVRAYYEYDCKGLKARRRFLSTHSDSMAAGNVVFAASDSIAEWADEGLDKKMLSIVCN